MKETIDIEKSKGIILEEDHSMISKRNNYESDQNIYAKTNEINNNDHFKFAINEDTNRSQNRTQYIIN